ncbi:MAG: ABC transporter ATP-binding protein, partial [Oscillospiraceae bacterium]
MNKQVIKRLLSYTKPHALFLIFALISALLNVSLTLLVPVFVGQGIDLIIGVENVNFAGLPAILGMLVASIVGAAGFQWLMAYCTNVIAYRTSKDLRIQLFDKLSAVPLRFIDQTSHGNLINRVVNSIDEVSDGLLQGFTQLFTGVITIVGTLLFMLFANPTITLIVVVLTPLSLLVAYFIAKSSYRHFHSQTAIQGELTGFIEEMISNQKLVKAFGYEEQAQEKFEEINQRLYTQG